MAWLSKVKDFLLNVFSSKTASAILTGIRAAAPYVSSAMEVAAMAAQLTGGSTGRTVSTVLQLADRLGVQALLRPAATDAELGTALRDITVASLKLKYPDASTATLNRAVELAVGTIKP